MKNMSKNIIHKKPKQVRKDIEIIRVLKNTKKLIQQYALNNDRYDYEALSELVDMALEKR